MTIEPKFKIGDLIRHKYSKSVPKDDSLAAMEVLFIHTETCSAGTQIFYNCRLLYQVTKSPFAKEMSSVINILPGDKSDFRIREDEAVTCPEDLIKLIIEEQKSE